MLYAVTGPTLGRIYYFLTERPDEPGLEVEAGVRVEPLDWKTGAAWPEGADRPDQVLCRSKSDPKLFKEFKYRRDIDPDQFEELGKRFGGIFSKLQWARHIRGGTAEELARRWEESSRVRAATVDDTDNDELYDEVLRNLGVDPVTGRGLGS